MADFKIKSNLNLYGYSINNFSIQADSGFPVSPIMGRTQFYTGGGDYANHIVVYDGKTWKAVSFTDDVKNNEDFINLKARVDAFLNGEVNSNDVLDNLREIQQFLDTYGDTTKLVTILGEINDDIAEQGERISDLESKATQVSVLQTISAGKEIAKVTIDGNTTKLYAPANYAWNEISGTPTTLAGYGILDAFTKTEADGRYLKTIGGILSGQLTISSADWASQLVLKGINQQVGIKFQKDDTHLGYLLVNESKKLLWQPAETAYAVIHEGNIAEQSVTFASNAGSVNGYKVTSSESPFGTIPLIRKDGVMEVGRFLDFHFDNTTASDFSTRLYVSGNNDAEIGLPSASGTLALLTDTVEAANKLAKSVSLWGNSFDGTSGIDSNIKFGFGNAMLSVWNDAAKTDYTIFAQVNPEGHLLLGQGTAKKKGGTYIYGDTIRMCFGASGSSTNTAMTITGSGGVVSDGIFYAKQSAFFYGYNFYGKDKEGIAIYDGGVKWHNSNYTTPEGSDLMSFAYSVIKLHKSAILDNGATINGKLYANAGADITGDVYVDGNVHITGNLFTEKELGGGGVGTPSTGGGTGGGTAASGLFAVKRIAEGVQSIVLNHGLDTRNLVICIYEKDENALTEQWNMCLTDVEIISEMEIRVSFGSATTTEHKVVIMGAA